MIEVDGVLDSLITIENDGQHSRLKFFIGGCEFHKDEYDINIKVTFKKKGIFKIDPKYNLRLSFGDCNSLEGRFGTLTYKFDVESTTEDILAQSPLPQHTFVFGEDTEGRTSRKEMHWIKVE